MVFAGALSLLTLSSCNYEEINTNQYEVTEEMETMDGIAVGASITTMERYVFPVGTKADGTDIINQYQVAITFRQTAGADISARITGGIAVCAT